ncbi:hypothetical protein ACIBKY_41910 [Nonomuraea sp. NPDC050394]|uniref:hypothetical protein n=1 Tax=Nonomuraea sp. NPDC050394 TaxID=3364363 RepID=UPI0037A6BCA8
MADGSAKPIEQVEAGEKVLATDPETGQATPRGVVYLRTNLNTGEEYVGIAEPGNWIHAGGGKEPIPGSVLTNKRYQMSDPKYKAAGWRRMLIKYREGDLLQIPIIHDRAATGQVVKTLQGNIILGVFDSPHGMREAVDVAELDLDIPIFLAETMDSAIETGTWRIVGSRSVSPNIIIPVYKVPVGLQGDYYLQDVYGNIGQRLSPNEARLLKHPRSYSPALIEGAIRAFYGHEPWLPLYDEIAQ